MMELGTISDCLKIECPNLKKEHGEYVCPDHGKLGKMFSCRKFDSLASRTEVYGHV